MERNSISREVLCVTAHLFVVKMAKIQSDFPVWSYLVIFLMCINSNNGQLETNQVNLNLINFNEIKSDLFSESASNVLSESAEFIHQNPTPDVNECLYELNSIKEAVVKYEPWALKSTFYWKIKTINFCECQQFWFLH